MPIPPPVPPKKPKNFRFLNEAYSFSRSISKSEGDDFEERNEIFKKELNFKEKLNFMKDKPISNIELINFQSKSHSINHINDIDSNKKSTKIVNSKNVYNSNHSSSTTFDASNKTVSVNISSNNIYSSYNILPHHNYCQDKILMKPRIKSKPIPPARSLKASTILTSSSFDDLFEKNNELNLCPSPRSSFSPSSTSSSTTSSNIYSFKPVPLLRKYQKSLDELRINSVYDFPSFCSAITTTTTTNSTVSTHTHYSFKLDLNNNTISENNNYNINNNNNGANNSISEIKSTHDNNKLKIKPNPPSKSNIRELRNALFLTRPSTTIDEITTTSFPSESTASSATTTTTTTTKVTPGFVVTPRSKTLHAHIARKGIPTPFNIVQLEQLQQKLKQLSIPLPTNQEPLFSPLSPSLKQSGSKLEESINEDYYYGNRNIKSPGIDESFNFSSDDGLSDPETLDQDYFDLRGDDEEEEEDEEGLKKKKMRKEENLEFNRPSKDVMNQSIPIATSTHKSLGMKKIHKGYLFKLSMDNSANRLTSKLGNNWQKRWAVLDEKYLKYFASEKSTISRKVIPVCIMANVKQEIKSSETHGFRLKIITNNKKVFNFAASSNDEFSLWANMIMKSIISYTNNNSEPMKEGGELHNPLMQGYIKIDELKGKKYCACRSNMLAIYQNYSDYISFLPIHLISLQLTKVKHSSKLKLNIYEAHHSFVFNFENQIELEQWKVSIETLIALSFGDDVIIDKIYKNNNNKICADCFQENPEWAATNLGITLCQNCAGVHRCMENAKIRSLRMDLKIWTPNIIKIMVDIGNENSNNLWSFQNKEEARVPNDCEPNKRKDFILSKYVTKVNFNLHSFYNQKELLNKELISNLHSGDLVTTLKLIYSGADVDQVLFSINSDVKTTNFNSTQLELLKLNNFLCKSSTSSP